MFTRTIAPPGPNIRRLLLALSLILLTLTAGAEAWVHNVAAGDKGYIQESTGVLFLPFVYLGAKNMVTGYDQRFREFSKRQPLGTDRPLIYGAGGRDRTCAEDGASIGERGQTERSDRDRKADFDGRLLEVEVPLIPDAKIRGGRHFEPAQKIVYDRLVLDDQDYDFGRPTAHDADIEVGGIPRPELSDRRLARFKFGLGYRRRTINYVHREDPKAAVSRFRKAVRVEARIFQTCVLSLLNRTPQIMILLRRGTAAGHRN